MSNTPRRRKIQAHSHSKSLKDSLADLSKHKHLRGSVIEALGNTVSVRMNLNGSILHGIELVGGPVAVDDIVSVDYASSTPIAYAIGETITLPSIPKAFVPPITDSPLPISLSEFIYSIILYDASEFRTFEFPVSNDGMDSAIAAADTGDGITIPNSNVITTTIDIPAGVSLRGQSIDGTIISGKVTLGNGSHISNLSIEIDFNE